MSARRQARETRVDDLIASARRWSAVAKNPKVKDRWREHWLCTLERLAEDRELCKKLDAVEPKAEGRMRRMNDGYGLVKEGLRSLDDWSARNHRPAAAHRQHYANLATRARSLASALRAEDRMLIPMAQLTGNWIDANSLRIFVSQVTEAAGLRLSREEVSRIADFPGCMLKLYTPSVPRCLDQIAADLDVIGARGTATPRPSDPDVSRRSYLLRRLIDYAETHHRAPSRTVVAEVASFLLGSPVEPADVSRLVNGRSRARRKT